MLDTMGNVSSNPFVHMTDTTRSSPEKVRLCAPGCPRPALFDLTRTDGLIRLATRVSGCWIPTRGLAPRPVCDLARLGSEIPCDYALARQFRWEVVSLDATPTVAAHTRTKAGPPQRGLAPLGRADSNGQVRFHVPRDPSHAWYSVSSLRRTKSFIGAPVRTPSAVMNLGWIALAIDNADNDVLGAVDGSKMYFVLTCGELDEPQWVPGTWRAVGARELRRYGRGRVETFRSEVVWCHA